MRLATYLMVCVLSCLLVSEALAVTPQPGWRDSYSANGQCYCATTYDHDIAGILVDTAQGQKTVQEICERIGNGPGIGSNPIYNDIQCGNGPANNSGDEDPGVCPGRVDQGEGGCLVTGPTWNLDRFFPAPNPPDPDPVIPPAPDPDPAPDVIVVPGTPPYPTPDTDEPAGIAIEAEDHSTADSRWQLINSTTDFSGDDFWIDPDVQHANGASQGEYLELLPDTRSSNGDAITNETNWSAGGEGPTLAYSVNFTDAGRYAVSVRAYSSNDEDDSIFIGVDDVWSAEGGTIALCGAKNAWAWSDCDGSQSAYVDIPTAGSHTFQFSASEDGFELDRFVLSRVLSPAPLPEPEIVRAVRIGGREQVPAIGLLSGLSLICLFGFAVRRR